jgi:predicted lipoprotein with Yx(FWY)xxD motif
MAIRTAVSSLLVLSSFAGTGCYAEREKPPYAGGESYGSGNVDGAYGSDIVGIAQGGSPASGGAAGGEARGDGLADVLLQHSAAFDGYLSDAEGQALYMFANDVPGSSASACTAACVTNWPVFDIKELDVGEELTRGDFSRFQRADGAWQTSFKGRPLYYYAMDTGAESVAGDGMGGRWFLARDYFAFVGAKTDLVPLGAAYPAPYLTNRAGRTIYIFMSDTVANGGSPPISACNDGCLDKWPTWNAPADLNTLILPSAMTAAGFGQFERIVGDATIKQLTYQGWPLYFFAQDELPGETSGHLMGAWRAIDPT